MNNRFITKLTYICLYGLMGISILEILSYLMQIRFFNDYFVRNLYSEEEFNIRADRNDVRVSLVTIIFIGFLVSAWVIIGRWLFISAKINHLSGIKGLRFKPGWAVGWYFIPIANLLMPYRSLQETFKASFKLEEGQSKKIPIDFPIWWISFWLGYILGNISFSMSQSLGDLYTYEEVNKITYITISSDFMLIISSVFFLRIVKIISNNQKNENFQPK